MAQKLIQTQTQQQVQQQRLSQQQLLQVKLLEMPLAELEQIVQGMEGGRLPLEESIAAYRRGSELLKHCQQQLSDAESKIQILENGALRDFDINAGGVR